MAHRVKFGNSKLSRKVFKAKLKKETTKGCFFAVVNSGFILKFLSVSENHLVFQNVLTWQLGILNKKVKTKCEQVR